MGSLFLVRHATTEASLAGVNLGQHDDAPLTPAGQQLAARTGGAIRAELAALPEGEIRLVSSPARRCRETAAAVGGALDDATHPLQVDPGLWEIDYGAWEGLTAEQSMARDPQLRTAWEADPYTTRTPGGESGADVARRAFAVLMPLEAWLAEQPGRAAVVVSHNHVVRLRLTALLEMPMADYRRRIQADPGGYSLVTFNPDGSIVRRINALPPESIGADAG
jgi:broad specificity phosphatase PhoE